MGDVIEWLKEARPEITAGLVLALLGWLYSRYRVFMKMYRLKKKELERMEGEMFKFGNTKKEIERLQEALKESEAQRQDMRSQLEVLQQELQRKDEALKESEAQRADMQAKLEQLQEELQCKDEALKQAEAQIADEAKRRAEIQSQLDSVKAELDRKTEAETQRQADAQRISELQSHLEATKQELERIKHPPMSDEDFLGLCKSGDAKQVEEAIMNGANVNANNYGQTALMWAENRKRTDTANLLRRYGAR